MPNFRYEYPNPHLPRVKTAIEQAMDDFEANRAGSVRFRQPTADYFADPHRTIHVGANSIEDGRDLLRWGRLACFVSAGLVVGVAIGWGVWG